MTSSSVAPIARAARIEDVPNVAAISGYVQQLHNDQHPDVFRTPNIAGAEDFFRQQLVREDAHVFVVESPDGTVVGYAFASVKDKPASPFSMARKTIEFEHLAVKEAAQGQRYGQALIEAVNQLAKSLGADEIHLTVWLFNERAINLYEYMDFSKVRLEMVRRPKLA